MGEKLVIGPYNKGLRNDVTPFRIDNESFPTLINAYQWRGRVKRKRGTQFLCRLQKFFNSTNPTYSSTSTTTLDGTGSANILTAFASFETNATLVLGSVTIIDSTSNNTFTDNSMGVLTGTPAGAGTINYLTGAITITSGGSPGDTISASFSYYPLLPTLGLEELILAGMQFPGQLAFDTTYSYEIQTSSPYNAYNVSFYKNPPSGTPSMYVAKTNFTTLTWNGQNYQQFWTTNFQGSLWATNGTTQPFTTTNIGMQFAPASSIAYVSNTGTTLTVTISGSPLVIGDFVFVNEWTGTNASTLNFQTGYVTAISPNIVITFPNAAIGAGPYTPGIIQYLTNRSSTTKDCLRWFDGDPTNGSASTPVLVNGKGWVNFMPPLSQAIYSIAELPAAQYYLVGAKMILPFKDRLLFFGPVIQASIGNPMYLQDTIIYSQNGTPYYTASFTGNPLLATTVFNPILTPANQTATPTAYWEDQTGFGGFISAGIDRQITTVSTNEDALIVGFDSNVQTRVIYSGNDIVPFNFFIINAELGSSSTFSAINMDFGVITKGNRGYIIASQTQVSRIDLEIPDEVFETRLTNNGTERVCAQRDFINEWIYFTYPSDSNDQAVYVYPTQTLQYNYRDNSWAIFRESYTTYGTFRQQTGFTWGTVGDKYASWSVWNDPWDAGESELLQPVVIGGNQEGFVLVRGIGTGEGQSLAILGISGDTITCPDHCLNPNDFIIINGAIGTIDQFVNEMIFQVATVTENTFTIPGLTGTGTYVGGGLITRIYIPQIQTKQFPVAWDFARKTRIGPQQYLFSTTANGQITLQIFLSQNAASAYNDPVANPNGAIIYSQILYTCPESTNLGLTPANINLQSPTGIQQSQIWHRMNTSLIGDTVQIGFTLSPAQITTENIIGTPIVITGASQAYPCVLTCTQPFNVENGELLQIQNVVGMTQLNGNTYLVLSSTSTEISLDVDSSGFTAYVSGGTATQVAPNPFAEIELHGMILDVAPSQLLS
jgi:Ubiquitin-activating enzyme E1 FCCH domain